MHSRPRRAPFPTSRAIAMQNPSIQHIIDDAEQNQDSTSIFDLSVQLGPFIAQYPLVPDFRRILSWLYANLRPQKTSNLSLLVTASIDCLTLVKAHSGRREVYADITRDLEKNWPNIWRCMSLIHTRLVDNADLASKIRLPTGYTNLNLLMIFASDDSLCHIAGKTPGVVAMLMRISDLEVSTNSQALDVAHDAVNGLNTFLRIMGQQPSPRWDEEVLAPLGGSVKRVACLALKRLSFHISQPSTNAHHLAQIANKITHISHLSNHDAICHAFVAQRSIRLLVDVMGTLSNLPLNTESLESMTHCISNACNCLRWHMFATEGITGIIEGFDANILPTLLRCAHMLTTDDKSYFSLLCGDLPKFIIYPSVLRAAKKSLKEFDRDTLVWAESQTPRLKRVWEAYSRFKQSMDEIDLVKEDEIEVGTEVCNNETCRKMAPRSTLYLCKNCRGVYYCSTACQREDWKAQHRSRCKVEASNVEPIPSRDQSFLRSLARTELFSRSLRIRHACQKHNIGAPVVQFKYAEYPFKITVGSTTSLFPPGYEEDGIRKEWEATLKDGASTPGAWVVMILYPTGQNTRVQASKVIVPDMDSSTGTTDDSVLDYYYTMQLIKDDGSFCSV